MATQEEKRYINFDEQLPPHDNEAEKSVLGALLIDSDAMTDVLNICKTEHFYSEQTKNIFDAMHKIYSRGEKIDEVTVARQLHTDKKYNEVGGAAFLANLIADTPTPLHVIYYAKIVKNLSISRQIIGAANKMMNMGYGLAEPTEALSTSEKLILGIQSELAMPHLITPEQVAEGGFQRYADLLHGKQVSLKTGIHELDRLTGGMFNGEYWILGARPSMGKTTLALQIANYIAKQGNNILFVSIEQSWREILDRRVASKTGRSIKIIRSGNYDKHGEKVGEAIYEDIQTAMQDIAQENLYFYDTGEIVSQEVATVQSIFSIANHMKLAYGLSAVFIDYLHLIGDEVGNHNEEQRISFISRNIKKMARTLNVPVFVLAQLSRFVETQTDRKPKLSNLRSSGSLEQDADVVLFAYRDDYYPDIVKEAKTKGNDVIGRALLILAKQRQGLGVSEAEIDLLWDNTKLEYLNMVRESDTPDQFR